MAKLLSASALAQYHRDGFYVPIRVLSREEAGGCRRRLETYEAERGGAIGGELRHKTHRHHRPVPVSEAERRGARSGRRT